MGSRFGGPKQLEPIGPHGETLLELTLADAHRAGFRRAVVVTRAALLERLQATLATRIREAMDVRIVLQDDPTRAKPWGTGHAVLCARPEIDAPFAVANADDLYGADAWRQMARGLRGLGENTEDASSSRAALVAYPLHATLSAHGGVSRGVCRTDPESNRLLGVEEVVALHLTGDREIAGRTIDGRTRSVAPAELVSLNLWGFDRDVFAHLERGFDVFQPTAGPDAEFLLPALIDELVRSQRIRVAVLTTSSKWIGITHREDLEIAKRAIGAAFAEGRYSSPLFP